MQSEKSFEENVKHIAVLIKCKILNLQPSGNKYFCNFLLQKCVLIDRVFTLIPKLQYLPLATRLTGDKRSGFIWCVVVSSHYKYIKKKLLRSKSCPTFISAGARTQRFPDCPASSYSLGTFWWGSRLGLTHLHVAIYDEFLKNLPTFRSWTVMFRAVCVK